METTSKAMRSSFFNKAIFSQAMKDAFSKINPRMLVKNPVMFVVAVGSLISTYVVGVDIGGGHIQPILAL